MDVTLNREYPYPECEPPLVKDASDIIQLQQLATAIDTDMQALSDAVETQMAYPPSAKMFANGIVTTLSDFTVFYDNFSWNTQNDLVNTSLGGFVIQTPGFYLVTAWAGAATTNNMHLRLQLMVNNLPTGNWQGYSRNTTGVTSQVQQMSVTLFLEEGDLVSNRVRHAFPGSSITYIGRIHIVQLVSLA